MSLIREIHKHVHRGKIWKIYLDAESELFLCEERREETREALFYLYDLSSFQRKPITVEMDESWWVGVHEMYSGVIIFNFYN